MEQSHWQTVIRWIVLHPERRTVLVSQREGRLVLPTSTSTGDIWLGDCPALLEAAAGIGLDAIVLGCRELDDDHDNQLRRLTMAVTLRDLAVTVPPTPGGSRARTRPRCYRLASRRCEPAGPRGRTRAGSMTPSAGCAAGWRMSAGRSPGPLSSTELGAVERRPSSDGCRAGVAQGFGGFACSPRGRGLALWPTGSRLTYRPRWPGTTTGGWCCWRTSDRGSAGTRRRAQEQVLVDFARLQAATAERLRRAAARWAWSIVDQPAGGAGGGAGSRTWKHRTVARPRLGDMADGGGDGRAAGCAAASGDAVRRAGRRTGADHAVHGDLHMSNVAAEPGLGRCCSTGRTPA